MTGDAGYRTLSDVAEQDAEWRAAAAAGGPVDRQKEGAALRALLSSSDNASATDYRERCHQICGAGRRGRLVVAFRLNPGACSR